MLLAISALKLLEFLAFGSSLMFTWLAAGEKRSAWNWGAVSAISTGILCIKTGIYSEASLQVYYLWIAIYTWIKWGENKKQVIPIIKSMPWTLHLGILLTGIVLMLGLGWFWSHFGAALPYLDAFTTSFSLAAVWLLSKKYLQSWIYWIIIDTVSIYLYLDRGLPILAILFGLYTLLAMYGYHSWSLKLRNRVHSDQN